MNGFVAKSRNVCNVNFDLAVANEIEDVGWEIEDREAGGYPEGVDPGLEFLGFRVRVIFVESYNVVA